MINHNTWKAYLSEATETHSFQSLREEGLTAWEMTLVLAGLRIIETSVSQRYDWLVITFMMTTRPCLETASSAIELTPMT